MSFVLQAQRPCLKLISVYPVVHSTGHYCYFTVHASLVALTQACITGWRFGCLLDTLSPICCFLFVLVCNSCLPSHTHTWWLNHTQLNIARLPLCGLQPFHLKIISLSVPLEVFSLSRPSRVIWWSGWHQVSGWIVGQSACQELYLLTIFLTILLMEVFVVSEICTSQI